MTATVDASVRRYRVEISDKELDDLRSRIAATRWPERETVTETAKACLSRSCRTSRGTGRRATTWVDATRSSTACRTSLRSRRARHPLHPRPVPARGRLPIIVTHGWPGSILEQLKIIEPLTNPTAHGGEASDAFHVVIPSLPGHGFSAKAGSAGVGSGADRACVGGADEAARVTSISSRKAVTGAPRSRSNG